MLGGHCPALVRRQQDFKRFEVTLNDPDDDDLSNRPLAMMPDSTFTQQSIPPAEGDRVVLYTDGVIEAPDREGNSFGINHLKAVLEVQKNGSLPDLKSTVINEWRTHTRGGLSHDDVTLLAADVNGLSMAL